MSDRFSYSKLSTYDPGHGGCPFRYYLQYTCGFYAYTGSIATEFGTAIHQCEEAIAKAICNSQPIDYITLKNQFILTNIKLQQKYPVEYYADDGKSDRNYLAKMQYYLTTGIYRLEAFMSAHPNYKIIGIEEKFNFDYDAEHSFNGAIDRVLYDESTDSYLIQDIKSWAVPAEQKDLATPLQFVVYTLAAKQLWGADITRVTCQYDLPLVDMYQDGGTQGFMARGQKKIDELFAKIAEQDFTPKTSPLCHWCPFSRTNQNSSDEFKWLCPYCSAWTRENKTFSTEYSWTGIDKYQSILENYKVQHGVIEKHE